MSVELIIEFRAPELVDVKVSKLKLEAYNIENAVKFEETGINISETTGYSNDYEVQDPDLVRLKEAANSSSVMLDFITDRIAFVFSFSNPKDVFVPEKFRDKTLLLFRLNKPLKLKLKNGEHTYKMYDNIYAWRLAFDEDDKLILKEIPTYSLETQA